MNLTKLFETQRVLDEHIYDKHPELRGQDNLDWKILALQVELAECANEWRGFKKWSNNQVPRIKVEYLCVYCNGIGLVKPDDFSSGMPCEECKGTGKIGESNPLLGEYVDCLHFTLSIGNEIGYSEFREGRMKEYFAQVSEEERVEITGHFIAINYITACMLEDEIHYEHALFEILDLGARLGFTWDQIEDAYFAKNKINHERQNNGY